MDALTDYNATGADQADLFFQSHPGASSRILPLGRPGVWGLRLSGPPAAAAPLPRTLGHPVQRVPLLCAPVDWGSGCLLGLTTHR